MDKKLATLADEVEAALELDAALKEQVTTALEKTDLSSLQGIDLDSTDSVLELVHELRPSWYLTMTGTVRLPNGHWKCILRQSDVRDNDAYIGIGCGPNLPHALIASLLKALALST